MTMQNLLNPFKTPSAKIMAKRELEEAQRQLLQAQAGAEYASAMVQYHSQRIARLKSMLIEANA